MDSLRLRSLAPADENLVGVMAVVVMVMMVVQMCIRDRFITVTTACSRVICARGAKEPFACPFIRPMAVANETPS